MALGATTGDVLRMVLGKGLLLVGGGITSACWPASPSPG